MVKTGQVWSGLVVTKDATGALAAPSAGPAGVLYVDGTANAAVVTVSGANPYKWTVTLPSLTAGQCVSMYITATIATIATASVVAEDVADTVRLSDVPAVNVTLWKGSAPSDLDGLGTVPVGTLQEIDLSGFSEANKTVTAADFGDVRDYLVGMVAILEYEVAPP